MIYLELYWCFFQIGLLSFGGGMAAIPLIEEQVVNHYQWLSLTEFTDLITIAEMTPGPIAINAATFVGIQVTDIIGAVIATLGCITPSCIIVFVLAWIYSRYKDILILQGALDGLRPAVVALIASAGITILTLALFGENGWQAEIGNIDVIALGIFLSGVFVLRKWKSISPIKVMLGSGVIGGLIYYFQ